MIFPKIAKNDIFEGVLTIFELGLVSSRPSDRTGGAQIK